MVGFSRPTVIAIQYRKNRCGVTWTLLLKLEIPCFKKAQRRIPLEKGTTCAPLPASNPKTRYLFDDSNLRKWLPNRRKWATLHALGHF